MQSKVASDLIVVNSYTNLKEEEDEDLLGDLAMPQPPS